MKEEAKWKSCQNAEGNMSASKSQNPLEGGFPLHIIKEENTMAEASNQIVEIPKAPIEKNFEISQNLLTGSMGKWTISLLCSHLKLSSHTLNHSWLNLQLINPYITFLQELWTLASLL